MDMTIGQLAAAAGVGVETIRYYQRRGLLPEPPRDVVPGAPIRRYDDAAVERLSFIRQAKAGGFTLSEIGELLALDAGEDRIKARELAARRIAALDRTMAEMAAARAALARLLDACEADDAGPCPIIAAFDGQGTAPACHKPAAA